MKTKHEIIEESVAYIKENGRGTKTYEVSPDNPSCVYYNSETGAMCLVGRCLIDPQKAENEDIGALDNHLYTLQEEAIDPDSVYDEEECLIDLENRLKPEYRGHKLSFWLDLQEFHDTSSNWETEHEMSIGGKNVLSEIKRHWA
jgi:hypothetical protein